MLRCKIFFVVLLITLYKQNSLLGFKSYHSILKTYKVPSNMFMSADPLISLGAGSLAGVIGIGTAYPFDSLKTKAQIYRSVTNATGSDFTISEVAIRTLREDGIQGFYSGVLGVMIGEAFVKATLFGSNAFALMLLSSIAHTSSPTLWELALAAAFSGVVSSFVLNPIERVKVLMQADTEGQFTSEIDCIQKVIRSDGIFGLLTRGLDAMLIREVPGCTFYFLVYSLLKASILTQIIGDSSAAFVSGAAAGVCAWIPIYPSDVIKT